MKLKHQTWLLAFMIGFASQAVAQQNEKAIVDGKDTVLLNENPANSMLLQRYLEVDSKVNDPMRFVYLTAAANAFGELNDEVKSGQAMLGVHVRATDETLRKQLQIKGDFGLVVEHVVEESAAEKFEINMHDVLYKLDEQLLANAQQFQALIDSYKPGDQVAVELFRGGKIVKLDIELSEKKFNSISLKNLEEYHKSLLTNANPHFKSWQVHDCKTCHVVDSLASNKGLPLPNQPLPTLIRSRLYPTFQSNSADQK